MPEYNEVALKSKTMVAGVFGMDFLVAAWEGW
jgi:hypothetical protein